MPSPGDSAMLYGAYRAPNIDLGIRLYPEYVFQTPSFWSKINLSNKVRHQIKAEVMIFLLRYWSGVEFNSPLRTNGRKLSKAESLVDFG